MVFKNINHFFKIKVLEFSVGARYNKLLLDEEIKMEQTFGAYRRGGSIGNGGLTLIETFTDKEIAKDVAKRLRKTLTPGEKSYYKIGYSVKK